MNATVFRQCCRAPTAAPMTFSEAVDDHRPMAGTGEVLATIHDVPLDPAIAHHEAAHAVFAFTIGVPIAAVSIAPARRVDLAGPIPDCHDSAVLSLVGPAAESWFSRTIFRPEDDELLPFAERVYDLWPGRCDRCQAMRSALFELGADAEPNAMIDRYREFESAAIEFVRKPQNWRAIRALAGELMATPRLDGDRVTVILKEFFLML